MMGLMEFLDRDSDITDPLNSPHRPHVFSVSQLNFAAKTVLSDGFPDPVWIEGELSNFSRPKSGHWYFSLKDSQAQVRCAMFRSRNQTLGFVPQDGMHVLLHGSVGLYEGRGEFQIIVEFMEEAGDGRLRRQFELLKARLAAEGLFAPERKKPLPRLPLTVGVVTSPSGAAIRDIISVLGRRFPAARIVIYPTDVQGQQAAGQIAAAIAAADRHAAADVLIVARGGGSLEDLWPFNEEVTARAIAACTIPVVSGVGHEIDTTIADLAADRRAATPSAAAELVVPDQVEWVKVVTQLAERLQRCFREQLTRQREQLRFLSYRLRKHHPQQSLHQRMQRLDDLDQRSRRAMGVILERHHARVHRAGAALAVCSPQRHLERQGQRVNLLHRRLGHAIEQTLQRCHHRLAVQGRSLDTVSPLATLNRGYAMVIRPDDDTIIRDAGTLTPGQQLETRLARGRFSATVTRICNDEPIDTIK